MRRSRLFSILLLSTIATVLMVLLGSARAYAVVEVTDGAKAAPPASPRLIVELETPPLAQAFKTSVSAAAADGTLDVNASAAQAYIAEIQAEQAAFVQQLQAAMPDVTVSNYINEMGVAEEATYQVVVNAVAIDVGDRDRNEARAEIARMSGVKSVYLDVPYQTQLYTSTELINAPVVWNSPAIGGVENAGEGMRFASIDGGIHKDAPMFSGEGYSYPNGYGPNGLGLTANNNGKIIVSRAYFRPWDPPAPGDENPWPGERGTPHGTHTASTAAGNCVDDATYAGYPVGRICGVAPRAYVMSYRVFYWSVTGNESFYTVEGVAAIEDAVRDGAHVINNSWGGGPLSEGGEFDILDTALINATNAGVFVSMSAGNAGPGLGTGDHPSEDYINVAASTTSGTLAAGRFSVAAPAPVPPDHQDFPFGTAEFGATLPFGDIVTHPFKTAADVDPGNVQGCNPFPPNAFNGVAAVISRGTCEFSLKVFHAEQAGATFAVIYNNDGDDILNMAAGAQAELVTIMSVFIGQSDGEKLLDWYDTHGDASTLEINAVAFQVGNEPDRVINFSSRGPAVGNRLKPDITAPGVNILAQGYAPEAGATGEDRHLGYGQVSGTSMAAPHVAGAALLLRQLHPTWTPDEIKSVLMSTAKYLDIYNADGKPAQPLDIGAGRLDIAAATEAGVILDPPNVSLGLVTTATQQTIEITVRSIAGQPETYEISTLYTGDSFTQTTEAAGFSVSPTTLTLGPGETKTISVTFDSALSRGFGDNQGYIVLDGAEYDAHLPAWARVVRETPLADVLIIDNDFSTELGFTNYLANYTTALDELGLTYAVVDTGDWVGMETTIPDAATLLAYRAVILFTGDNYLPDGSFTVSTGLTQLDQDRLVEYLNSGGALIAMGQDLSLAVNSAVTDEGNVFYTYRLGANWIQDSLTNEEVPTSLVLPPNTAPEVFKDVVVDLTRVQRVVARGALEGEQEVPPVDTETVGDFALSYDFNLNRLEYEWTVVPPGTTITVTMAHIHRGEAGINGPIVRDLYQPGELSAVIDAPLTLSGVITDLTPAELLELLAGDYYVNVHTEDYPGGEIRGQIEMEPDALQVYMDEVDNEFHDGSQDPDPNSPDNLHSIAILSYHGLHNLQDGTVGLAYRDQPTLERPGITYRGRTIYTTFGLEGMENSFNPTIEITPTTQSELIGVFLDWVWSEPGTPNIVANPASASSTVFFTATLEPGDVVETAAVAQDPPEAASYRWDFGDGSGFVESVTAAVGHQYQCAEDNNYTVRVEITDQYGNVAIGSLPFDASEVCFEEPETIHNRMLPWIPNDIE